MGACAGCTGPQRRDENFKVTRLTENSPLKSKVTPSGIGMSRSRDYIVEELMDTKSRVNPVNGPNNLIGTLINSPLVDPTASKINQSSYLPTREVRDYGNELLATNHNRDSAGDITRSMFPLRKTESFIDENIRDTYTGNDLKVAAKPVFASELRTINNGQNVLADILGRNQPDRNQTKSNLRDSSELRVFSKGGRSESKLGGDVMKRILGDIPELPDEEARTPQYVREIREKNGQDVLASGLQDVPRKLERAPTLNLLQYLGQFQQQQQS